MAEIHQPVLLEESMFWLAIQPTDTYVDMTVGAGGHALNILQRLTDPGRLIGVDHDPEILALAAEKLASQKQQFSLHQDAFSNIESIFKKCNVSKINGALFDLGVSSYQLDKSTRGFSFQQEGPLDMRMNPQNPVTAAEIVNTYSVEDLANLIWTYGEESHSRKIAQAIVEARKKKAIKSTLELATLIAQLSPNAHFFIHPATKTFQALRIAVNQELDELQAGLDHILPYLAPEARLVVISFHSLEDRIVKHFMKKHEAELEILTPKPILPGKAEQRLNPRSRSAKLRCAKRK